jgi:hypothetical protein
MEKPCATLAAGIHRAARPSAHYRAAPPTGVLSSATTSVTSPTTTGSVCEPIPEKTTRRYHYIAQRGGSWHTTSDQNFRVVNRNGILPTSEIVEMGIRLVADLPSASR